MTATRAPDRVRPPVLRRRPSDVLISGAAPPRPSRSLPLLLAGCLTLAVASLGLPAEPTYDPWAWIVWGREILHGDLVTSGGPSWKPLPILFTVPFAGAGDPAPELWLVVARAGGLLAIAMAWRLAARLAGPAAGAVAAVAVASSDDFVRHFMRGFSEGLLVGIVLLALDRHLAGRRPQAFALAVAAGLLRPEVWPFVGLYGLWLAWREPRRRPAVAGGLGLTALLWFVPEYVGSGDFLRAAERAREANLDSPAYADHPWLEVLRRSGHLLPAPVLGLAAAGLAARRRDGLVLATGAAAGVLIAAVVGMTQMGFAGNLRYVALPAGLVCVLAGVGAAEMVRRLGPLAAVVLVLGSAPYAEVAWQRLQQDARSVRAEARLVRALPAAIDRAGGAARVNACGGVFAGRYEVPVVAWELGRHLEDVDIFAYPPGHTLSKRGSALAADPRFPIVARAGEWAVGRRCLAP